MWTCPLEFVSFGQDVLEPKRIGHHSNEVAFRDNSGAVKRLSKSVSTCLRRTVWSSYSFDSLLNCVLLDQQDKHCTLSTKLGQKRRWRRACSSWKYWGALSSFFMPPPYILHCWFRFCVFLFLSCDSYDAMRMRILCGTLESVSSMFTNLLFHCATNWPIKDRSNELSSWNMM